MGMERGFALSPLIWQGLAARPEQSRHGWCSFATVPRTGGNILPVISLAAPVKSMETPLLALFYKNRVAAVSNYPSGECSQMRLKSILIVTLALGVSACSSNRSATTTSAPTGPVEFNNDIDASRSDKSSIWDLLGPDRSERSANVNRYLWAASLDVLSFLPVQSVDPFTGVIVTGYGVPPGGGRSYRATVHVKDPALDARSLKVSLQTSGGRPVSASTSRAVEDAILSRARQLRIADDKL